jgi:hypothetical protein
VAAEVAAATPAKKIRAMGTRPRHQPLRLRLRLRLRLLLLILRRGARSLGW